MSRFRTNPKKVVLAVVLAMVVIAFFVNNRNEKSLGVVVADLSDLGVGFRRIRVGPLSRFVAVVNKDSLHVINTETWKTEFHLSGEYTSAAWSTDGNLLCLTTWVGVEIVEVESWRRSPLEVISGQTINCCALTENAFLVNSDEAIDPELIGPGGVFVVQYDRLNGFVEITKQAEGSFASLSVEGDLVAAQTNFEGLSLYRLSDDFSLIDKNHIESSSADAGAGAVSLSPKRDSLAYLARDGLFVFRESSEWAKVKVNSNPPEEMGYSPCIIDNLIHLPDSHTCVWSGRNGLFLWENNSKVRRISKQPVSCLDVFSENELILIDGKRRLRVLRLNLTAR